MENWIAFEVDVSFMETSVPRHVHQPSLLSTWKTEFSRQTCTDSSTDFREKEGPMFTAGGDDIPQGGCIGHSPICLNIRNAAIGGFSHDSIASILEGDLIIAFSCKFQLHQIFQRRANETISGFARKQQRYGCIRPSFAQSCLCFKREEQMFSPPLQGRRPQRSCAHHIDLHAVTDEDTDWLILRSKSEIWLTKGWIDGDHKEKAAIFD